MLVSNQTHRDIHCVGSKIGENHEFAADVGVPKRIGRAHDGSCRCWEWNVDKWKFTASDLLAPFETLGAAKLARIS
jgi:hypothetical protein